MPLRRVGSKPQGGLPILQHQNPKSTHITSSYENQQGLSLPKMDDWRCRELLKGPTHKFTYAATYPGLWQSEGCPNGLETLEERLWTERQCLWHYGWNNTNSHRLQKSCGGRRMTQLLSQWKRGPAPSLAWTGFYCFSGHITFRMVLIYYAQVRFRWLPFTENKSENVTNYIKNICKCKRKSGWTGYTRPWEV